LNLPHVNFSKPPTLARMGMSDPVGLAQPAALEFTPKNELVAVKRNGPALNDIAAEPGHNVASIAIQRRTAISSYRQFCLFGQRCGDSYHASIRSPLNRCACANVHRAALIPNERRMWENGCTCEGRPSRCSLHSPCQITPWRRGSGLRNQMAVEQQSISRKCHRKCKMTVVLSLTLQ
jgi:hypothetical protein